MQKSCADLIKGEGWEYFRAIEKKCFFDFIKKDSNFILSLGGGTIPEAVLPKEISDHLNIIWLQRTDEEILLHLKSFLDLFIDSDPIKLPEPLPCDLKIIIGQTAYDFFSSKDED
jgi:shikimate kinase